MSTLDILAAPVLMLTVTVAAVMESVFIRPDTPIHPLKPTIRTPFEFPTATLTPLPMEATWTLTFIFATDTATLAPMIALEPSPTIVALVPPTKTPARFLAVSWWPRSASR